MNLNIEPGCETVLPCGNSAAYAVRISCGCLVLVCRDCLDRDRNELARHEAAHPTCGLRWHCSRCGGNQAVRAPGLFDQIFVSVVPL